MGFPGLIVVHIAMVTVVAVDRFIVDIDCVLYLACTTCIFGKRIVLLQAI